MHTSALLYCKYGAIHHIMNYASHFFPVIFSVLAECWEIVFVMKTCAARSASHHIHSIINFHRHFSLFGYDNMLQVCVDRQSSETWVTNTLLCFRIDVYTECYLWTRKSVASLPNRTRRTTWAKISLEHTLAFYIQNLWWDHEIWCIDVKRQRPGLKN